LTGVGSRADTHNHLLVGTVRGQRRDPLRTSRYIASCTIAAVATALVAIGPTAQAKTPKCFGQKATQVGTAGDDTLVGTKKVDVFVGKGGNDILLGKGGADLLCGNSGDDTIGGLAGNDRMDGGTGDNQLYYGSATKGVTANLATEQATGEGTDLIRRFHSVGGSDFDDNLTGDGNVNFLFGYGGNDVLVGGPSGSDQDTTDIIDPGDGDDQVDGGGGFDMVSYQSRPQNENGTTTGVNVDLSAHTASGFGTDAINNFEAVWGSEQDDILTGDSNDNFLVPAGGDDQVTGGGGTDSVIFWFATQPVTANLDNGTATGEGSDTLANDLEGLFGSTTADDQLTGDNKNNFISGDGGNDTVNGGQGDDWLGGGAGNDTVDGGQGNYDLVDFSTLSVPGALSAGVTVNLAAGTSTGEGTDHFSNTEAVFGSLFDDTITGDADANYFFGWFGADTINGGEGNDEIDAGPNGADGTGDQVDGGPGNNKCAEAEQAVNCTVVTFSEIQQHPLNVQAAEIASFRRNF
jgi:Ca2+-binding RTX toxin-like protein